MSFNNSENWVILNPIELSIKEKIEQYGTKLQDWDLSINRGILTGYNDAFIIDEATKNSLIAADPKSAELIRPILRGKDIKRYTYNFANLWLIYVPWHFPLHNDPSIKGASIKAEEEFKKQYPAVYSYLEGHKEKLSKRNKAETGIRYEWYALQRWGSNYSDDFNKPKIIYPCIMSKSPSFILDEKAIFYTVAPGNIITGAHLKYLNVCLNSSIFYFALRKYYMGGGIEGELKTNRLLILPIPKYEDIKYESTRKIEDFYNKVISSIDDNEIFNDCLNKIDRLLSSVLNLTEEEYSYIINYTF